MGNGEVPRGNAEYHGEPNVGGFSPKQRSVLLWPAGLLCYTVSGMTAREGNNVYRSRRRNPVGGRRERQNYRFFGGKGRSSGPLPRRRQRRAHHHVKRQNV